MTVFYIVVRQKMLLLSSSFSLGYNKKSHGLKSGEYSGWSKVYVACFLSLRFWNKILSELRFYAMECYHCVKLFFIVLVEIMNNFVCFWWIFSSFRNEFIIYEISLELLQCSWLNYSDQLQFLYSYNFLLVSRCLLVGIFFYIVLSFTINYTWFHTSLQHRLK